MEPDELDFKDDIQEKKREVGKGALEHIQFEDYKIGDKFRDHRRSSKGNSEIVFELTKKWPYLASVKCLQSLEGIKVKVKDEDKGYRQLTLGHISTSTGYKIRARLKRYLGIYTVNQIKHSMRSSFKRILWYIDEALPGIHAYFNRKDPLKPEPVKQEKVSWMMKPRYKRKSKMEKLIDKYTPKEKKKLIGGYTEIELEDIMGKVEPDPRQSYA